MDLTFRLHCNYPIVMEFNVYPIDIYRQKTDEDFIGTLNIYQINSTLQSTSTTSVNDVFQRERNQSIDSM